MKHLHYAANEHAGFGELFDQERTPAALILIRHIFRRNTYARNWQTKLEAVVLSALREHPNGLTNHGLVRVTGIDWNTITPRIAPLVRKGLVFDSGKRREGPTNRSCIVWMAS